VKLVSQFFCSTNFNPSKKSLHWCFTFTALALMGALMIIFIKPIVKIALELLQALVQLLSKGDPVELIQDCLMKGFADPGHHIRPCP